MRPSLRAPSRAPSASASRVRVRWDVAGKRAMPLEHVVCEGGTCELFGFFGICVQGLIGAWCILTLLVLWRCEANRRSFFTWVGDMSKQLVGAGWGHFMNVFLAMFLGAVMEDSPDNNQCVWYLVGFLSDIFFVTFLCWLLTNFARPHIRRICGIDIGDYENAEGGEGAGKAEKPELEQSEEVAAAKRMPWWMMWLCQTGLWLLIMTTVKALVTIGVYLAQNMLYTGIAQAFKSAGLCHHQRLQLVTSVIIVPVIGDAFQFAVQDSFLKKTEKPKPEQDGDYAAFGGGGAGKGVELGDARQMTRDEAFKGQDSDASTDSDSRGSQSESERGCCT